MAIEREKNHRAVVKRAMFFFPSSSILKQRNENRTRCIVRSQMKAIEKRSEWRKNWKISGKTLKWHLTNENGQKRIRSERKARRKKKEIETSPVQLWKHIVITLNIKRPEDKRENMLLFSTPLKFSLSLIKVFGKEIKFQAQQQQQQKHAECVSQKK